MTLNPQPSNSNHPRGHPREIDQAVLPKNHNFVGREFVFTALNNFLSGHNRGYFTIVGAPGSGKTAILTKYVAENSDVIDYDAQVEGKNRVEEFLTDICQEIIETYSSTFFTEENFSNLYNLDNYTTQSSGFLSLLLQKISDRLQPSQRFIIAIDGCDRIERRHQPPGANLFYLPRYLPKGIYFLLTRRPYLKRNSGLLIEAPSQVLDLQAYPAENAADVRSYIHSYLTPENSPPTDSLQSWLTRNHLTVEELCDRLIYESENNFMYLTHTINAILEDSHPQAPLPPALETYYQQHWQKMQLADLSGVALGVLRILTADEKPTSAAAIAQILDEDEYEVEEVLENWYEFLQLQQVDGETYYNVYHSSFRLWLAKQISNS